MKALQANEYDVTVVSRYNSSATFPPTTKVVKVTDGYPEDEMIAVFKGADAVVLGLRLRGVPGRPELGAPEPGRGGPLAGPVPVGVPSLRDLAPGLAYFRTAYRRLHRGGRRRRRGRGPLRDGAEVDARRDVQSCAAKAVVAEALVAALDAAADPEVTVVQIAFGARGLCQKHGTKQRRNTDARSQRPSQIGSI